MLHDVTACGYSDFRLVRDRAGQHGRQLILLSGNTAMQLFRRSYSYNF